MAAELLDWYHANKRDLPWRADYTPYGVWISEVMLQQTQMERGVSYWLRWMERFPDVAAVAAAPEEDILHAWEGLGYYRRARFLHAAAKAMVHNHHGSVPDAPEALAALPGLGAYTVAAIRAIAFRHDVVVVDANVERVFSRILNITEPPKRKGAAARIRQAAESLLPSGQARNYNQALMELGALVCGKNPRCHACPWEKRCESRRLGVEKERPVPEPKPELIPVTAAYGILLADSGIMSAECVFVRKRPETGLWAGLWEFPGDQVRPGETPSQAVIRFFKEHFYLDVTVRERLGTVRHGYTNHKLTAHFFLVEAPDGTAVELPPEWPDLRKLAVTDTGSVAMPSHHRKLAKSLFSRPRSQRMIQGRLEN